MWAMQSAAKAFAAPPVAPAQPVPATPAVTPPSKAYDGTIYTVVKGDNLTFIARKFGVRSWRDIYFHPDNAAFRALRPNPDLIYPGDVLKIPTNLQTLGGR
jgi:LysM repeat protein